MTFISRLYCAKALGISTVLLTAASAWAEPQTFDSPEAAVEAVIGALEARDVSALVSVFGAENQDVILSGDDAEDRDDWIAFLSAYKALNRIGPDGDDAATLYIGRDLWPFPVPLVRIDGGWLFDAVAAEEEILLRRIGENELEVIDLLRGYVRAQAEYRATDPNGDGLPTFATDIISDPGTRNGLYWEASDGGTESPIGDFMARASADGYNIDGEDLEPEPYSGYYFRILMRQGDAAPGGSIDYVINGHMIGGHAMLAFPAEYGESGVMSFMVGEAGLIYEADLGEDTLDVAGAITSFDPSEGWALLDE